MLSAWQTLQQYLYNTAWHMQSLQTYQLFIVYNVQLLIGLLHGELAESGLMQQSWKLSNRNVPWVRIPHSPPHKGFLVRIGVTHGPLVKRLRHRSFTASTVGSIPPRVTIRHLYTVVKDRTHHGCLVVYTTQQLRISLQIKQLLQRVDGGFDTDHM